MKNNRIIFFDILRITAILIVVIGHILITTSNPIFKARYGIPFFYYQLIAGYGVTLFIICSGSVLALTYPKLDNLKQIKDFYYKRIIRIYPAYWVALIFVLIMLFIFNTDYLNQFTYITYIESFSGLSMYFNDGNDFIMPVGWFVGLIITLYLLYPLLIKLFNKNIILTFLVLLIITLFSRLTIGYFQLSGGSEQLINWCPLCRLFEFGLGIFIIKIGLYPKWGLNKRLAVIIIFLSNISFYVYLTHGLFYDGRLNNLGFTPITYILISLFIIFIVSVLLYFFDNKVQKVLRRNYS